MMYEASLVQATEGKHPQLLDDWDEPGWPGAWRPPQAAFGSASRFVGIAEATDRADDTWDANQFITLDDQKQISTGTGAAGTKVPDQSDLGAWNVGPIELQLAVEP